MANFYYQIKGKENTNTGFGSPWAWPPIFSGMVEANNKKSARLLVEDEYGRKFPLRVLSKDLEKEKYLLHIREVKSDNAREHKLFIVQNCKHCNCEFRVIDKYNDHEATYKGDDYCSHKCRQKYQEGNISFTPKDNFNYASAYIYKITNKNTGMVYIGKTSQVFTLRWYQHFYHHGNCKFHQAIKDSDFTDWTFTVVEMVETPKNEDAKSFVSSRENHWINKFDSIQNGYNSVAA